MASVKRQVAEHPTFQQDVKLLSDKTNELNSSDSLRRAKEAVSVGSSVVGIAAQKVGEGVGAVLDSTPVKAAGHVVGAINATVVKAAEPILDTKAAKAVASGVSSIQNDLASKAPNAQYIEYRTAEERESLKKKHFMRKAAQPVTFADPEAGGAVVVAQESAWVKSWREFNEKNPLAQNLAKVSKAIEESDNPVIETARDVWYKVGRFFDETEEAKCIAAFRMIDPTFRKEEFLAEAAQFVIPEILEGNLTGDLAPIKKWCNEKVFAEISASVGQQRVANLVSACKLIDLSQVDIKKLMFLNDDKTLPVVVLTFRTQEVLKFVDKKTGEVKLGSDDTLDTANYAVAMTKDQCLAVDFPVDPETGGWRVISWTRMGGKF
ncbi:protein translocase subunit [Entophlyctis luteolus]|nr:protein translocase subunit [Entophlyctis luteolus]KAJ3357865.1 protein translocase subunit [Entophlyctis luteolus]